MKRFVFAMVLLAIVLGGGGMLEWLLSDFDKEMQQYCASVEYYAKAKAWDDLQKEIEIIERFWDKKESALTYLVDHEHLNTISAALGELRMALETQDELEVLLSNARMRSEASSVVGDTRFSPENIF